VRYTLTIIFIFVLGLGCFAQSSYKSEKFKQELKKLAGTEKVDTTDFDKVSKINTGFGRKAYAKALSAENELALWQVHYAYALSTYTYTPEQEAIVREGAKFLKVEFFQAKRLPMDEYKRSKFYQDMADYQARVNEAFRMNPQLYRDTFEIPGDTEVEIVSMCQLKQRAQLGGLIAYKERMTDARFLVASFTKNEPTAAPACNCSVAAGCASWKCGCGRCYEVIDCGPWGGFSCNYLCDSPYCPD
jgi:hypothetical protein